MEQEYETIDLREIFYLIKDNFIKIILSVLGCAVAGLLITIFLLTPQYEAKADLIVNNGANQSAIITYEQINSAKQLVGPSIIILKSDTVLDRVIKNLKLNTVEGMENVTAESLAKIVDVVGVDSTQVLRITVRHPDAKIAEAIVQEIVTLAPDMIVNTIKAGSVEVISAPRAQKKPVSPKKAMNTLIAGLFGLVASVGFIMMKEMLNNTISDDVDIQKHLGLTVLGVIPRIEIEE
ncbi:MAG: Wzz/FepE/Etk N-terminal domain-containing protein [Oscillospiraceae bacterium]